MNERSTNGCAGRDGQGRFLPGNTEGRGNPFARRSAALRRAFYEAVTEEDLQVIARKLATEAKAGDWAATKLLLL